MSPKMLQLTYSAPIGVLRVLRQGEKPPSDGPVLFCILLGFKVQGLGA